MELKDLYLDQCEKLGLSDEDAKKLIEEATTAMKYGYAKILEHPFLSKQNETTKASHLKSRTWRKRYTNQQYNGQDNNGYKALELAYKVAVAETKALDRVIKRRNEK